MLLGPPVPAMVPAILPPEKNLKSLKLLVPTRSCMPVKVTRLPTRPLPGPVMTQVVKCPNPCVALSELVPLPPLKVTGPVAGSSSWN
jgi:hypothetical protein